MTLLQLLNQLTTGKVYMSCAFTWVFYYLLESGLHRQWTEYTKLKYLIEDITGECKTNVSNRTNVY